MTPTEPAQFASPSPPLAQPTFRSGAVARMAGMPVATLRIWEQRYQAVRSTTAPSGHRLYSAADVQRVTWLRRLTEQGHAIGLLAALDLPQLREMMTAPAAAGSSSASDLLRPPDILRIVVVGKPLAHRLQQWSDRQPGGCVFQWVGVFDSLADAAHAAPPVAQTEVDWLVWQAPGLQPGADQELRAAQTAWHAQSAAVVYRYSSAAGRAAFSGAGAALLHEPASDEAWGPWLASLKQSATLAAEKRRRPALTHSVTKDLADQRVSAPRFADLALTEFAGMSSAIACECPSHLAQLLLQISNFETYSGDCANKSPADAQLHAYLQQVAGAARMLFETALERVALAEGLALPGSPVAGSHSTAVGTQAAPAPSLL